MNTKKCNKCGATKALGQFTKDRSMKAGIKNACKQCLAEQHKQYLQIHREKVNAVKARYREEHPKKITEYYQANREKIAVRRSVYRKAHPEKRAAYAVKYHKLHPEISVCKSAARLRTLVCENGERPPCEHCGNSGEHWHHPDYSKPKEMISLCVKCHLKEHGRKPIEKRGA